MSPRPKPSTPSRLEAAAAAQLAPFSWVVPRGVPEVVTEKKEPTQAQRRFRFRLAHILSPKSGTLCLPVNKLANTLSAGGFDHGDDGMTPTLIEVFPEHGITFHDPEAIALTLAERYQGIGPTTQEKLNRLMLRLATAPELNLDSE